MTELSLACNSSVVNLKQDQGKSLCQKGNAY